ncbi:hypothetical protein JCM14076_12080 [Methylosoma difficile]
MTPSTENLPNLTRFVAFYSYKGGVGRTLALANCARALAAGGKKIVLMDLDLEAPGLLNFDAFKPKSGEKKPAGFSEYIKTCLQEGPPETLDGYIHECRGEPNDEGKVWLMPAGRHLDAGYLDFLNGSTWNDFYTQQEGYKILENLRGHIINCFEPDYVFIDSRTGLSEIGGIATHQLADIIVLVFNLNGQNLDGAKRVFDSIRKHAPLNPQVILVASPVPVVPTEKGTPFFDKMQKIAKDFKGAVNHEKPLVIPYHPLLAFADRLLVDEGDLFSTDAPYRQLAKTIQKISDDADIYLQHIGKSLQRGDFQEVIAIAQQGLHKTPANFYLLGNLATAYFVSGSLEKGITVTNELLQHHGNNKEPRQLELISHSMFNKGFALGQLQRLEETIAAYNDLVERFGDATDLALQEDVAAALVNKGVALGQLHRPQEAIATYDDLLGRFGNTTAVALKEQVAKALINKGVTLGQLQRPQEAIAAYDDLLGRFGDATAVALQEQVAKALFNKGFALGQLQRQEEEIAAYDDLLGRFGDATVVALQEQVAKALVNKGVTLGQLQRQEEEIAAYDDLLGRFGNTTAVDLQEQVAKALNSKGFILLLDAKKHRNNLEQSNQLLQTALSHFEQAINRSAHENKAIKLGNQAYTLFLLGKIEESEAILKAALKQGGQTLYDAELADSHINEIPEDEAFRALLEKCWQATNTDKRA